MKKMSVVWVAAILMLSGSAFSEDTDPSAIFERVASTYRAMPTYQSEGTITVDIHTEKLKLNQKTTFSMMLKKPNLYLITWTQKNGSAPEMVQSGAAWSDGTQPYLYMGVMKAYSKMVSDEMALSAATGVSGGAASTIPTLFLPSFGENPAPFSRLHAPTMEAPEKIGENECYVISGASAASKKETYWISKSTFLVIQYSRSLEAPEEGRTMPEMTDQQIEAAVKGMGQEATEESMNKMKEILKKSRETLETAQLKGDSIELHMDISSPELDPADFQFAPPAGTVLKDSLFGEIL